MSSLSRARLTSSKTYWPYARAFGIVVLFLVVVVPLAVRLPRTNTEDFGYFYRAAEAMRHGEDIYAATDGNYIYPPLLAFVFQPLTVFPERPAFVVWLILSAAISIAAAFIAASENARQWLPAEGELRRNQVWLIAGLALLLNGDKLQKIFGLGQTDCLILLAFALVLRWMERRPALAGIVVGASANVKYLSLVFVPYFVLKRNYRAAVSAILSFVFFLALPAVEIGFARALTYAETAFGGLGRMIGLTSSKLNVHIFPVTWHRSVSITSAVFRLTRSQGWSDLMAGTLLLLIFAAVMTAILIIARRNGAEIFRRDTMSQPLVSLEWAVLVFIALAFSPQTSSRHMILSLLIYTVAATVFFTQRKSGPRIRLAGAAILLAAALTFPLGGEHAHALEKWRAVGGASWCAFLLTLVLIGTGARTLRENQS